ncbi:serine/threonine-protein kinase [Catellatospora tritici]|uniref:serine/threonine-protein kinase n=1 Tax=Catellatospora tritici TaxID=2851566 RepID=UPI001C2D226B|nr:serine/threonine-protein kinase [Catellatospora tritici]MBV1854624.1 serine/threonine protein kinase [Catellatospora tritici]
MSAFTPGLKLHDRYLLERRIGSGGMAEVWRAHDLVLGRPVAVKVLAGPMAADPALRAGALREARSAAQLTHPNITAVHDFGEASFPDGHAEPYLVMELLTGDSLADRMAAGPMPWPQVATVGGQIAAALAAAHARDVVHRDVKPGNIMLTATGAKVLDFGIAAMTGLPDAHGGWVIGTPAYAAPERLQQAAANPAADVYSLGVLLVEMVTGRRLHPVESWEQVAALHARPRPLPHLPGVPSTAAALIAAALDPSPARRPRAADLQRVLTGAPGTGHGAVGVPAGPTPTLLAPTGGSISGAARVPSAPATRQYVPPPPQMIRRRRRTPVLGFTLLMVLLLVGGMFVLFSAMRPTDGDASPPPATTRAAVKPSRSPSPSPKPTRATSIAAGNDLLLDIGQRATTLVVTGDIAPGHAGDITSALTALTLRWNTHQWKSVINRTKEFQKQLDGWVDDGDVSKDAGEELDGKLDELIDLADELKG